MAESQRRFSEQAKMAAQLDMKSSFEEMDNFTRQLVRRERANLLSLRNFIGDEALSHFNVESFTRNLMDWAGVEKDEVENFIKELDAAPPDGEIPLRSGPAGPLSVFGYNYLADHYGAENAAKLSIYSKLGGLQGPTSPIRRATADDYAYEILNLVNGKRTVHEIRDAVSAEFGPVPLEWVQEFLRALASIHVVQWAKN